MHATVNLGQLFNAWIQKNNQSFREFYTAINALVRMNWITHPQKGPLNKNTKLQTEKHSFPLTRWTFKIILPS